jgi:N-acetylneuraminate synthase
MSQREHRVLIIAEAGVNHDGSLDRARALVDAAHQAGADAVKFQSFQADRLVSRHAPKAAYQQSATAPAESQLEMLRRLELGEPEHRALIEHCAARGIRFLSSPFDLPSVDLLTGRFGLSLLKIASGQIANAPLLLRAARAGAAVIVSTGMSTLSDIEAALGVLAFGYAGGDRAPSQAAFEQAWAAPASRQLLHDRVTLLHCTTEYPAPFTEVNLRAMDTLRQAFGLPVGFSDHTPGIAIPLAAVARGATVIEKHFTLDRSLPGPDHKASLEPPELAAMVAGIRQVQVALGDGCKVPVPSELGNRAVARQSLVAAVAIKQGEPFTEENLGFKRPGTGISPMRYWQILGTRASRDYARDEAIDDGQRGSA